MSEFISKKLKTAKYRLLKDRTYFGSIPGLQGVWADAKNLEDCREGLKAVLEDWLLLKIQSGDKIPDFALPTERRDLLRHV